MEPKEAYSIIADWLFYHGFTDTEDGNFDGELLDAINELEKVVDSYENIKAQLKEAKGYLHSDFSFKRF